MAFTKANIQTLKQGRTLKAVKVGRNKPDIDGDDGIFEGTIMVYVHEEPL